MKKLLIVAAILMVGCGKSKYTTVNAPEVPQADVLLEIEVMEEVEGCYKSGAVVTTGLDLNENGEIEAEEIVETETICNKFYKVKKCKKKLDDEESSDD